MNNVTYNKHAITKNNTRVFVDGVKWKVTLHDTTIFCMDMARGVISLDTGGWFTVTTKRRMNEAFKAFGLNQRVVQVDGYWRVYTSGQEYIPFNADSIEVNL